MSQVIRATVENGVLRPAKRVGLPSGTKVRITLELCPEAATRARRSCDELDRLCDQFPVESGGVKLTRDQLHERR
jgi:predicted DNA-binding antitoxin AbrB/MazE fold protein